MINRLIVWWLARWSEASTRAGLVALFAALGLHVDPGLISLLTGLGLQVILIVKFVLAAGGLGAVIFPEKK